MAALRIRKDYADFKKHENDAFKAIVAGNLPKYERAMMKAVEAGNLVDMGLEYIENAYRFFSNFKLTKMSLLSPEEADALFASGRFARTDAPGGRPGGGAAKTG
jgi:hypothetical protein